MLSNKQRDKLRKILEKISTPEEMKAFDMELLAKNNEKTSEKIVEAIEKNKTEINWSFIENLINKTKDSLSEKIDDIKKEFSNKKYPTYDDSELQKKIDLILNDRKDNKFIEEATKKSQNQVIDELITIGDLLVSIRDISNQPKEENSDSFLMINKSLEGIGGILQKILSFTGSNDSTRIKDSTGTIINPTTEETAQSIAGFNIPPYDDIEITYVTVGNGVGQIQTVVYKLLTVTQATLTLSYDTSSKLISVIKS